MKKVGTIRSECNENGYVGHFTATDVIWASWCHIMCNVCAESGSFEGDA